jgi:hypothetical protein
VPLTICGPGCTVEESLFGVANERMSTELIYAASILPSLQFVRCALETAQKIVRTSLAAREAAFSLSFELPEFNVRRAGMLAAWNPESGCFKVGSSRIPPPGAQHWMAR